MSVNIALHLLSAVIWVGGMFFAHMALRPAAAQVLEPPHRLQLWVQVFKRFFHGMLQRGVYLAPSAFEAGFMSAAHSDADIKQTVAAAAEVFAQ